MSFDLAVWEGPTPESDEQAALVYEELMDRLERGETEEPSPAIRAYVAALLARWPDLDEPGGEDSPWAAGPLISEAFGNAIYFAMTWSRADEAAAFAASVAAEHGLVCYDPQSERLLPGGPRPSAWWRRSR